MSLINDALKRARVSALQQEAEANGTEYRAVPAHSRRDSRSTAQLAGWVVAAVAIAAVLFMALRSSPPASTAVAHPSGPSATTGGGNAAASVGRSQEPTSAPPAASLTEVVAPASEEAVGVAPGAVEGRPEPRVRSVMAETVPAESRPTESARSGAPQRESAQLESPPVEPRAVSPGGDPAVASGADDAGNETSRRDPGSTAVTERVSPSPPEPAPKSGRLADGAVYRRRATAADGSVVELGGIAYSEDRPIAVVNGTVVSPGDMIRGFVVLAIEPERVWLEVDGVRIYLSLR